MLGAPPDERPHRNFPLSTSHAPSNLHSHPSHSIQDHTPSIACGAFLPSPRARVLMAALLQCCRQRGSHPRARCCTYGSSSRAIGSSIRWTLLLCVGGQIGFTLATHATSIVMLPSGAMARLLTFDDHWHRGLFLLLWEAACGSYGHVVTRETLVALVISLPMIEVGFCGADGQLAAACIACIASARKKRSRVSQMSISGSSFCKGLRIHRSECC